LNDIAPDFPLDAKIEALVPDALPGKMPESNAEIKRCSTGT
jgi:hypothetical protein